MVLVLDAGNTLSGQWLAQQTQGRVLVEAMNAMGYDALALGELELSLGLPALRERQAEAKFPFLSANLVSLSDQKPLFQPYVLVERQNTRVGIIGLTEAEALQAADGAAGIDVLDPLQTATLYVEELREQVDLLIVLSHLGTPMDQLLAQRVAGIDIIIGGNTRELMRQPLRVGNTLIVQQGYRGEWMGRLAATFDAQGIPTSAEVQVLTLDASYQDDTEMAALVAKWAKLYPSPTPAPLPTAEVRRTTTPTPQ